MERLPLETVTARLKNFLDELTPNREHGEDLRAAAEHVARTSGYGSTKDMWRDLFSLTNTRN